MQTKLGKWLHHLGWGTKTEKEAEKGIQVEGRAGSKRLEPCKSTEDIGSKGNGGLALHRVSVWVTEKLDIHFGREEREKWSRKLKENLGSQKFFFHFGCCLGWLKYSYGLRRSLKGRKFEDFMNHFPSAFPKPLSFTWSQVLGRSLHHICQEVTYLEWAHMGPLPDTNSRRLVLPSPSQVKHS